MTSVSEREFMARVSSSDGFWKSLNTLSKTTGVEVDALECFGRDICRSVWSEADALMSSDGPAAAAREEVDRLKKKLVECNLSAMKQMLAAKANSHCEGALGNDTITFHEPMQYLDGNAKDLVMDIVVDKMRQLDSGTAPPSLVQALVQHVQAQSSPVETASMEELKETKAQLEDARVELRKARVRMEEAEELARKFEVRLQAAEDRALKFEQELTKTKTLLATSEAKLAEAEQALVQLRAEHAVLQDAHAKLQELSAEQQAKIERQAREIEMERRANEKLRAEIERLQEYVKKAEELEQALKALQVQFDALQTEAKVMKEELSRRNNTRTKGTQTTLTGSKLDEQKAETRKLKLMLEELQTKLKELMTEYRRKFGDAATKIAESLGLKELLKEETVFQRLYDDALNRVQRLEDLRAKVRKERKSMGGSPRSMASDTFLATEIPIEQAVEEHQPTPAMQRLVQDKIVNADQLQHGYPSPSLSWARPQQHEQGCGDEDVSGSAWQRLQKAAALPVMKTSSSLPSLRKAEQHVTMLALNLPGRKRKGSKSKDLLC